MYSYVAFENDHTVQSVEIQNLTMVMTMMTLTMITTMMTLTLKSVSAIIRHNNNHSYSLPNCSYTSLERISREQVILSLRVKMP